MNYLKINFGWHYDHAHAGAHYVVEDREGFLNGGQFKEYAPKRILGLDTKLDPVRFDLGSDIPELGASVKSDNASLTDVFLGNTKEEILRNYFDRVVSREFWWVDQPERDLLVVYKMDLNKFRKFCELFGAYRQSEKKVRFPKMNTKMLGWLKRNA